MHLVEAHPHLEAAAEQAEFHDDVLALLGTPSSSASAWGRSRPLPFMAIGPRVTEPQMLTEPLRCARRSEPEIGHRKT